MDLQSFISETLIQITRGVIEAQEAIEDTGCIINPSGFYKEGVVRTSDNDEYLTLNNVKMSLLVEAVDSNESKGGVGVIASVFKAGLEGKSAANYKEANRIEFEIPLALPRSYKVKPTSRVTF